MTITGVETSLEKSARLSKYAILLSSDRPGSRDMQFIMNTAALGLIQGFHTKMLEDACADVTRSNMTHKEKKRTLQKLFQTDNFFIGCDNIKVHALKIINSQSGYIFNDDMERIWLLTDLFLEKYILSHTFSVATNAFLAIISDMPRIDHESFDIVTQNMCKVNDEVSKEYQQRKASSYNDMSPEDKELLFSAWERGEMKKAGIAQENFFKIFGERHTFEHTASEYKKKLNAEKLSALADALNEVRIRS